MNPSPQSPGGIRECTRVRDWFSAATAPRARAAVSQRSRHPRFSAPPAITAAQKAARSLNVAHGSRSRAPGPGSRPVATLEVGGPWPHRRNDRAKPTLEPRRLRLQRVLDRVTDAIHSWATAMPLPPRSNPAAAWWTPKSPAWTTTSTTA